MALGTDEFLQVVKQLSNSDASLKIAAQAAFEAIPVSAKISQLLLLVQDHGVENRAAFAKMLDHQLAFNFVEFFGALDQQQRFAFLDSFFNCFEACYLSDSVNQQLCSCFAGIASGLHDKRGDWKEERELLVSKLFSLLEDETRQHLRVIGWSILARGPKGMLDKTWTDKLIELLERDVCSVNLDVAFEASCCLMSMVIQVHRLEKVPKSLSPVLSVFASSMSRFIVPGKEKLLRLLHVACDVMMYRGVFDDQAEKMVVDVLLPFALQMLSEEEKPIRALCLRLLPKLKLTELAYERIVEALPKIIRRELENGLEFLFDPVWLAIESTCSRFRCESSMRFDFSASLLNLLSSDTSLDRVKASAAFLIAAVAGAAKMGNAIAINRLAPLINDGIKHEDAKVRRAYCYVFNELILRGHRGSEFRKAYGSVVEDFVDPVRILQDEDAVVRSLTYRRFALYFSHVQPPTATQLRTAVQTWATVLEGELRKYMKTRVGFPLDEALVAVTKALDACKEPCGQQVGGLLPVLKMVACLVDSTSQCCLDFGSGDLAGKSGKQPIKPDCCMILSVAAIKCAIAALQRHHKASSEQHVPWMVVTLQKLKPVHHEDGLTKVELRLANDLQEAWKGVTELSRPHRRVLSDVLVPAVDVVMWKATARLPVEEVENALEAKYMARSSGKVCFVESRRLFCVDEEGLKSKTDALTVLKQFYLRDFAEIHQPRLVDIAAAMVGLAVTSPIDGELCLKDFDTQMNDNSLSTQASDLMHALLAMTRKAGQEDLLVRLWDVMEPPLLKALMGTKWRGCPDDLLNILSACLNLLPEERVVSILPSLTAMAAKGMEWFLSVSSSATMAADEDDEKNHDDEAMDESDEGEAPRLPEGLVALIEATIGKCGADRTQPLVESLVGHCEKLTALDARPGKLEFGLELLSKWLPLATSQGKERMDWLLERLLALMKRFSAEVLKQDQDPSGMALYDEWGFDIAILLEKAAKCLVILVPMYAQDGNAMTDALNQLLSHLGERPAVDNEGKLKKKWKKKLRDEEGFENVVVWNSWVILTIIKNVSPSDGAPALSAVASKAIKAILSNLLLVESHEETDRTVKVLVELFEAKNPAMMANAAGMVKFARKAYEEMGMEELHHIAWESDASNLVSEDEEEDYMMDSDDDFEDFDPDSSSEKYAAGFGEVGTSYTQWLEDRYSDYM